ncbi:MAG: hypothetical protein CME26_16245 [Gemmatimonadetes bacterium]|nr:hypothetical protein [Gemmatimonadota bacterium]
MKRGRENSDVEKFSEAEGIERKYRYRSLILKRKIKLPRVVARGMVGPDCAVHLYSQEVGKKAG